MSNNLSAMALLSVLSDDDIIIYRKKLNSVTGSVTATILFQQFIYRFSKNGFKKFYKFKDRCGHEKYADGDSWLEELGFTRSEFDTALSKIATKLRAGESKHEVMKRRDPQAMFVYCTDGDRVTWYEMNLEAVIANIMPLYVDVSPEEDFSDMFDVDAGDFEVGGLTEMDALGLTAASIDTSGSELKGVGWVVTPPSVADAIVAFHQVTGIPYPNSDAERSKWKKGARELVEEFGDGVEPLMRAAWSEYFDAVTRGDIDISHPKALKSKMLSINARKSLKASSDVGNVVTDEDGGMYL